MFTALSRALLIASVAVLVGSHARKEDLTRYVAHLTSQTAKIGRQDIIQDAGHSVLGRLEGISGMSKPKKPDSVKTEPILVKRTNRGKEYQLLQNEQVELLEDSSSNMSNDPAFGDKRLDELDREEAQDPISETDHIEPSENSQEKVQFQVNHLLRENTDSASGVHKTEEFHFLFNYTIDTSDMSFKCLGGSVNLTDRVFDLIVTLNTMFELLPEIRKKYAEENYGTSWEKYAHLNKKDLAARYVPLLPQLPDNFNVSVIRSTSTTSSLTSSSQAEGTAVTSLERVLKDAYSVMQLLNAAMDSVLLGHALSRPMPSLIENLTQLNRQVERILYRIWDLLAACKVRRNIEPLQHILSSSSVYRRENDDDIKQRGFLTIHHTEKAVQYIHHIMTSIELSLDVASKSPTEQ